MTEDEALQYAEAIMASFGVTIQRIAASNTEKRPDFEFTWGAEHYVVEMKQREAEWHLTEEEDKRLDAGQIVRRSERIDFHPIFAARMEKASRQIAAYKPPVSSFRLVWYCVYGVQAGLARQRVITTLLGDVWMHDLDSDRQWHAHYFDANLFVQLQDAIDGAVVVQVGEAGAVTIYLVLNPFSPRYASLKASNMVQALPDGTVDSYAMEEAGDVLIVDVNADRTSERALLNYLGEKYSINVPQILRMGSETGIVRPRASEN